MQGRGNNPISAVEWRYSDTIKNQWGEDTAPCRWCGAPSILGLFECQADYARREEITDSDPVIQARIHYRMSRWEI